MKRCGSMADCSDPSLCGSSLDGRLRQACSALWEGATSLDHEGADPVALCEPLRRQGMFVDALPLQAGGAGLIDDPLRLHGMLLNLGAANLSAARIYEGHVNAIKLVFLYGEPAQADALARAVRGGGVCGVWNAEGRDGLSLESTEEGGRLCGAKIFASGIGLVSHPLVTARNEAGGVQMLLPTAPTAFDLKAWTARGMKATATGTVMFEALDVDRAALIGAPGDYYRGPLFKGGAWRFAAAQAGAVLQIQRLLCEGLAARGRATDPHQRARLSAVAMAAHAAQMWTAKAAAMEGDDTTAPAALEAFAGLARLAVEKAALEAIALAERSLGLSAFLRPDPLDRVIRDLSTYLRQPFPDAVADETGAYVAGCGGAPPWSATASFAW